jgi:hypothetical protein
MKLPYVSVSHRFGKVSLRIVSKGRDGRKSTLMRLAPEEAKKLGKELINLGWRAEGGEQPTAALKLADRSDGVLNGTH